MDALRSVFKWISKHSWLSSTIVVILIACFVVGQVVYKRNAGTLSAPLEKGSIIEAVYGIGTIVASHRYSLNPGVVQTIDKLFVKEGDFVKSGSPLVTVDRVTYKAPFDGIVNYFPFRRGENVFNQNAMLVVTNMTDRYLTVSMEQQGAMRVKPRQNVRVSFDSIRNKTFDGIVESVYSYNSNFLARIDVKDLPAELLPDMTCDVAIIISKHENVLLIPTVAFEDGMVWVKSKDLEIARAVPVKLGIVDSNFAEVLEGDIHPGDRLTIHKKVLQ